jgi:hypothetical protein
MNNDQQVSKLQGLLARIQRNAALPRSGAPLPPAAFVPQASPAPAPAAAAPAVTAPATAYVPAYAPPPPAFDERSIDDLLGVSEPPPPVDVDIPLDTVPPEAEVADGGQPEAEPIPLVSVAPHESEPPRVPFDATFSLESEVSEVRASIAPRDAGPEVTVAAIEAEAEPITAEELSEDDLVEVTEGTPIPSTDLDIDFEEEADDRPPASSQRQVASSRGDSLAAAAQGEPEREVPLKTPPPESGPQEAPPPVMTAPAAPDVDALLGDELDIPTRGEAAAALAPTPEQLGQTIDLEEAAGPSLELAEPARSTLRPTPSEDLEVALPGREVAGGYDDGLMPPPEALDDLEAHRRRLEEDIAPPPESLATLPSVQPGPLPEIVPIVAAPHVEVATTPEVIARAAPEGAVEAFASVREAYRPSTFVELLDASLSLGR